MNPLYLGSAERRLFAIHEPAATTRGRARAAVLCHPCGVEYIYAHRSLRQLAVKLTMCGFHTLRFDYFGTGDSGGDLSEADLSGWEADAESAIETLKDIAGTTQVALIGLRVGANVAANVARRLPEEVEALILWDPIVSGPQYLQCLGEGADGHAIDPPFSARMRAELQAIDARTVIADAPSRSLVLVTEAPGALETLAKAAGQVTRGTPAVEFVRAPCPWVEAVTTSGALPVKVIQRIEEWLR